MTELISTPWKKDGYLLVRTHQGPPELVKQAVEQDYLRYHPVGYGTWARWDMMGRRWRGSESQAWSDRFHHHPW